jgi:predicted ester cyclase
MSNIEKNDNAAALYSKGDIEAFVDTYADDAVLRSPDGVFEGKAALREYWTQEKAAFPDSNVEMIRSIGDGDVVMGEWTWSGTHRGPLNLPDGTQVAPTGNRVEASGAEVVRFRDGLVVEHNLYFDNLAAMTQLGLLPG